MESGCNPHDLGGSYQMMALSWKMWQRKAPLLRLEIVDLTGGRKLTEYGAPIFQSSTREESKSQKTKNQVSRST